MRINRLGELASNLWWSWHDQAMELFLSLDAYLWDSTGHNPVKLLNNINRERLETLSIDPAFLTRYDSVMTAFDSELNSKESWFLIRYPEMKSKMIAYLSFEFAIHNSLPMYAGGLGVLAGDIIKEASDSGFPLTGIGFMYPEGYFKQKLNYEGWQEEIYTQLNFEDTPISHCHLSDNFMDTLRVQLADRPVYFDVWQVKAGRASVYLMDTNVPENIPGDRHLTARLYTADQEQRLQQEIILGMGGVKLLRALNIQPGIWHANEGHSAFMMLERIREEIESGRSYGEALERVKANTVFTTHTPIPAGTDVFPLLLMDKYFQDFLAKLGIDRETFYNLGRIKSSEQSFNMTVFSLKTAGYYNGVSKLHGEVARRMWQNIWPNARVSEVPIIHVTNGVHVPSWVAPELMDLYRKYLGPVWIKRHFDAEILNYVTEIPDKEFWSVRNNLRRKLIHVILSRAQARWSENRTTAQQILAMGALLEADALTIVFARRFIEYKRPALIFQDIERLKKIVTNRWRPVQLIFTGKSHPADMQSKALLKLVYSLSADREFQGRIAFVEDYDMHLAKFLVQGADVWLNNPHRHQEACGTSGIKAGLNGVLNCSILDGWWVEGFNKLNGWSIAEKNVNPFDESDKIDAESLYRIIEQEIVPLFYERDADDVPHRWLKMSKEAIKSIMPAFCARRMLKDYIEKMYLPIIKANRKINPENQSEENRI